jgi:hypothetical protein
MFSFHLMLDLALPRTASKTSKFSTLLPVYPGSLAEDPYGWILSSEERLRAGGNGRGSCAWLSAIERSKAHIREIMN